jgi:ABC-type lipoprotein release transport system permease subunit
MNKKGPHFNWDRTPLVLRGALHPLTFSAAVALLATVALAASYVPAWRAARVDPIVALRHE